MTRSQAGKLALAAALTTFFVGIGYALTQQSLPPDAGTSCASSLTAAEFNSWFTAGVASLNGAVKPANSVTFPDLPASLDFQSEGMFLSASGYKTLAIDSVNLPNATLGIDRVYRNNIFYLLSNDYWYPYHSYDRGEDEEETEEGAREVGEVSHTMGDAIVRKKIALRNLQNRKSVTTVSLEPYVKAHEPGLYRVVLAGGGRFEQKTAYEMEL